jgi:glycine cleavage system regulatory protein
MTTIIITVLGDDKAGLVDRLSAAIAQHQGNWVRSHMAELAGKFAGMVEATVGESDADALIASLDQIHAAGLLHIAAERAVDGAGGPSGQRLELHLVGQDHPGIIHQVARVLAQHNVSIDQLQTETAPAPQGGHVFRADAIVELPEGLDLDDLAIELEAIAQDLMIDLDVVEG